MKVSKNILCMILLSLFLLPFPAFASIKLVYGDLDTVGSTLKIGDEFFYVIEKVDDNHVQLLSKYNLGIGYGFEENPVYRQTVTASGGYEGSDPYVGGVCLSTTGYGFPSPKTPVVAAGFTNYVEYLTNQGVNVTKYDVLLQYQFNQIANVGYYARDAVPGKEFLYETAYWMGTEPDGPDNYTSTYSSYNRMVGINSSVGSIGYGFCHYVWGIRPAITIEIPENIEREVLNGTAIDPNLNESKYKLGDTIEIGGEEFYIIGKEDDTHLKLLSKYNLGAGNGFESPTNKQEASATGWKQNSDSNTGTMTFTDNFYWANSHSTETALQEKYGTTYPTYVYDESSNLYEIINNYVESLRTKAKVVSGRLIKQEELNGLGCNPYLYSCQDAPDWVYSTSYWTGSATNPGFLNYVITSGRFGEDSLLQSNKFGVRPVIILEIEKEEIVTPNQEEEVTEEEINPPTGTFISISLVILMIIIAVSLLIYSRKKSIFKKI